MFSHTLNNSNRSSLIEIRTVTALYQGRNAHQASQPLARGPEGLRGPTILETKGLRVPTESEYVCEIKIYFGQGPPPSVLHHCIKYRNRISLIEIPSVTTLDTVVYHNTIIQQCNITFSRLANAKVVEQRTYYKIDLSNMLCT